MAAQVQIYMTAEQTARVSALLLDALVGAQIEGDDLIDTAVLVTLVNIDTGDHSVARVHADGSWDDLGVST